MNVKMITAASGRAALTAAVSVVPGLLNVPGQACTVRLRGQSLTVIAELAESGLGLGARRRDPITDVLALELASGSGQNVDWPRPVALHAVVVAGQDAVRTVQRASRWASYASRVAVVPAERVSDHVRAEASLRGVWLVAADQPPSVVSAGEIGPTPGSERGLLHRLLDEVVLDVLVRKYPSPARFA